MASPSHLSLVTKPVRQMQPGFDQQYFVERKDLIAANGNNLVSRKEYQVEAALNLGDFAPFLTQWNSNRRSKRLPRTSDFDSVRSASTLTAVHLVDTSSTDTAGYRYLEFDCGSRMDGRDLSGIYVADYPGTAIRHSMLIDYESVARIGRCSLMEVSIASDGTPRKFARLILPVSESGSGVADRLLVVVRLLECAPAMPLSDRVNGATDGVPAAGSTGAAAGQPAWLAESRLSQAAWHASHDPASHILRKYFEAGQHEILDDRHLLELLLVRAMPEAAARELSDRLIEEFGSLASITAMSNERLIETPGLPLDTILHLKVVRELAARMIKSELTGKQLLSNAPAVIEYCHARMAHETVEHVRLLFLDQKNQLIKDEAIHGGSVSAVPVHPRQIVKRAIVLDAQSIILAHNHPSGDPSPSAADVELTLELKRSAQAVGIRLLDHLIIGRSGHVSLRGMGYLDQDSS